MIFYEVLRELRNQGLIFLPRENLEDVLSSSEILFDEDTLMSDHIRIIKMGEQIIVQEITMKNELSLRDIESLDEAKEFVQKRLDTYEKMWDGCGCKVNYYE